MITDEMVDRKWFVLPRAYPFQGYEVARNSVLGSKEFDNGLHGVIESAQSRAEQLNKESRE